MTPASSESEASGCDNLASAALLSGAERLSYNPFALSTFIAASSLYAAFSSYQTKSFRKKLQNVYSTQSPLVDCFHIKKDETFVIFTDNYRCLSIDTSSIPEKISRSSQGVKVINLNKNAKVERIELLESDDREWDFCKIKTIPSSAKKNKRLTTISFL